MNHLTDIKQKAIKYLKRYKTTQLLIAFVLFWTPMIIFAKLAGEVVERQPIGLDVTILKWIHSLSNSFLDHLFLGITTVGNAEFILPISLLILAFLFYKKQRLNALILLFGMGGAAASNVILKLIFHRDRPAFWHSLISETGYSFPSGHAMLSSALILCLVAILWNTKWRVTAIIAGALVVLAIGFSRLYMGVHYPTDIIAGWSVSLVWVLIVVAIARGLSYKFSKSIKKS